MTLVPEELFRTGREGVLRYVENQSYTSSFGSQWHMFPKTQLDSYSNLNISEVRLRRCLGETLWKNLDGKLVLEVGAGAGRFTEILLKQGARVVSVDLSEAVEVNAANFKPDNRHAVVQADVMRLPFKPMEFDIVICIGVIQHTPNSEKTIAKLNDQVKENGWLVIDHYRRTLAALSLRPLYRQILKRLSHKTAFGIIQNMGRIFLPMHRATKNSKVLSVLLNRVSPMVTYYSAFPALSDQAQTEWALLDTFDALTDWYKHFRNRSQIRACLENLGLTDLYVENGGNGVEARARKPRRQ